jgi:hypothetical protein
VRSDLRASGSLDVLIVFVRSAREMADRFERARARLEPDGGLWVCWPKQSSPLAPELRGSTVREWGLSSGLVDN